MASKPSLSHSHSLLTSNPNSNPNPNPNPKAGSSSTPTSSTSGAGPTASSTRSSIATASSPATRVPSLVHPPQMAMPIAAAVSGIAPTPSRPLAAGSQSHTAPSIAFTSIPWTGAGGFVNELPAFHGGDGDGEGESGRRSSQVSPKGSIETLHVLQPIQQGEEELEKPTLLIGISGAASAGKTTLAHLMLSLFSMETGKGTRPQAFLVQQDDFLVRKTLLVPSRSRSDASGSDGEGKEEEYDANCASAYDMVAFKRILRYAKREGRLPGRYRSAQDVETERENALRLQGVGAEMRAELANVIVQSGIFANRRVVGIVDGALLYPDPEIRELLDIKLFLRSSRATSLSRRLSRPEYAGSHVGGEYFWRTRLYFENVVWRNYVREYAPLFEYGDVEGFPRRSVCDGLRIRMQPGLDGGVGETLRWAVGVIVRDVREVEEFGGKREVEKGLEEEKTLPLARGLVLLERVRRKLYDWI